jgi:hypothetical protein
VCRNKTQETMKTVEQYRIRGKGEGRAVEELD